MTPDARALLTAADDLLSDPERWTQGDYACNIAGKYVSWSGWDAKDTLDRPYAFCAFGALHRCGLLQNAIRITVQAAALSLEVASERLFRKRVTTINDGPDPVAAYRQVRQLYAAALDAPGGGQE